MYIVVYSLINNRVNIVGSNFEKYKYNVIFFIIFLFDYYIFFILLSN